MHQNLTRIQEIMVNGMINYLKILEVSDKRPVIMSVLALAEKPLDAKEITTRSGLNVKDVNKGLSSLTQKGLIIESTQKKGIFAYELTDDLEGAVARNMQSKTEALKRKMKNDIHECDKLLKEAKSDFNEYDRLMAKYLKEKINKMKIATAIMAKRGSLLHILDTGAQDSADIKKISIE